MRRRVGRCFLSCGGYALRRSLIWLSLCCAVGSAGVLRACGAWFQCIGMTGLGWEPLFYSHMQGYFVGLSEYDTPKPCSFYEICHMDGSSFSQVLLETLGSFGV